MRVRRRRVSDWVQWRNATVHQLEHYFRTYRFYGLAAFIALVSVITFVLEVHAGGPAVRVAQLNSSSEYLSNFLDYTGLWVVLAAALFGGDALSIDFSTGAGYYMLVLPVRRRVLLAGRYAAATLVTLAIVGIYYAFGIAGAAYFFGGSTLPWATIGVSLALAALFALASLSVAFCVSSLFRSPASGVMVTVLVLFVAFTTLQATIELAGYEPWFSLTYAGGAMAAVLDTDFLHYQAVPVAEDQYFVLWSASAFEGGVIMAAYAAVFLPLSAVLYHRKESGG